MRSSRPATFVNAICWLDIHSRCRACRRRGTEVEGVWTACGPTATLLHAALGLLAVFVVLASFPSLATAGHAVVTPSPDYWTQNATRRDTVHSFVYRQSPQAVPTSYSPVSGPASSLTTDFRTLPSSNPVTEPLWRQARGTVAKPGLSPLLRSLGAIGLAVGTFELGWKIGDGINAKFLKIGIPEPQPPYTGGYPGLTYTLLYKVNSGRLYSNILPVPEGWYVEWADSDPLTRDGRGFSDTPEVCSGPPPGFGTVIGDDPALNWDCSYPAVPPSNNQFHVAIPGENSLAARGAAEDYTGQPYTKSSGRPNPPPQVTVEQRIGEELAKPENAQLRQWLNYKLYSPGEVDPTGIGAPNPDVEFPGFVEHWEDHGDEFTPAYTDPVEYWRDAAEIVKRGDLGESGYQRCQRSDGALIYWDDTKRAIVIVKDGKIVTFFKPEGPPPADYDYFLGQCSQ